MVHVFNPRTWETEDGIFLVRGQPGLQNEFQDSQGYKEKTCLEKKIVFSVELRELFLYLSVLLVGLQHCAVIDITTFIKIEP